MKRRGLVFLSIVFFILRVQSVQAAQWVQSGDDWYYIDENGQKLCNTVSEDGYWIDCYGKCVSFHSANDIFPYGKYDRERSSNFFIKYLETGDTRVLY